MLVPGASLLTPGFCEENPKESYEEHRLQIEYPVEKKKYKKETLLFKTRKNRPVTQHINISKEAYDAMLEEAPQNSRISQKHWLSMPKNERLKVHLDQIASDLKATRYSYEILDD